MYLLDVDSTSPTLYFVMVSISLIIVSKRYLHNEALGLYFFIKTGISLEKIISLNHMWVQVLFQYYTPLLSSIFISWLSHYLISPFPISYVKSFIFCYTPIVPQTFMLAIVYSTSLVSEVTTSCVFTSEYLELGTSNVK